MKVAFNRQLRRSPWGGGAHFATAFADYLVANSHEVVYSLLSGIDWIVMLDPRPEAGGFSVNEILNYKRQHPSTKILHRVNDTGVTRGGAELDRIILIANEAVADNTVFISEWVRDYFIGGGFDANKKHTVITNGCDSKFFHPPHLGEPQEPHSPLRLVTHHWSDNPAKGLDVYKYIDEHVFDLDVRFTYVGRYPKTYSPKNTQIIQPLYGKELGDELRRHDVYVTGARHEACGSHHVEGAACGMPVIFHREGGGVVEMCSRYGVGINGVDEIPRALEQIRANYRGLVNRAIKHDLSANGMCAKYLRVMEES